MCGLKISLACSVHRHAIVQAVACSSHGRRHAIVVPSGDDCSWLGGNGHQGTTASSSSGDQGSAGRHLRGCLGRRPQSLSETQVSTRCRLRILAPAAAAAAAARVYPAQYVRTLFFYQGQGDTLLVSFVKPCGGKKNSDVTNGSFTCSLTLLVAQSATSRKKQEK